MRRPTDGGPSHVNAWGLHDSMESALGCRGRLMTTKLRRPQCWSAQRWSQGACSRLLPGEGSSNRLWPALASATVAGGIEALMVLLMLKAKSAAAPLIHNQPVSAGPTGTTEQAGLKEQPLSTHQVGWSLRPTN